jgi:hypothetical protein
MFGVIALLLWGAHTGVLSSSITTDRFFPALAGRYNFESRRRDVEHTIRAPHPAFLQPDCALPEK